MGTMIRIPAWRFLALAALLAACGGSASAPPRWIELARGFEPRPLLPLVQRWHAGAGAGDRIFEVLYGVQVEHEIARTEWTRVDDEGTWIAPLPGGALGYGIPGFLRIAVGGEKLAPENGVCALNPGQIALESRGLVMTLPNGALPAESMMLSQRFEHGRPASGAWQVRMGAQIGDGIPVWSGEREEITCPIPPRSRLSFFARWTSRAAPGRAVFRVELDGESIVAIEEELTTLARGTWRTVDLPRPGRGTAKLAFEVAGPPGLGVFFEPVIGPAEPGRFGKRPWPERPDIVLFLADTLRADGLAIYGGDPGLAPNLNAFAQRCLRFLQARAPAAWTLPSIATLFTGLSPGQHGANDTDEALAPELETVTEALERAGYRTGAITDAAFFTPFYGLDQGFEHFLQRNPPEWNLERTIEEALAFLRRDDGRPVFLVVHTNRTHLPYRTGPEESPAAWDALAAQYPMLKHDHDLAPGEGSRLLAESKDRYRALYLEGVRALDAGFGHFLAELERLGFLERGVLVFTSDHGEALGENDDIFHAGSLWEVKLRIPLLLYGPGLGPRDVTSTATLLDLAPTLAGLAGIPVNPDWQGTPLAALTGERPTFAFRLQKERRQVAILDGDRKILTQDPSRLGAGACDEAYDLTADPLEEKNLVKESSWPAELARRLSGVTLLQLEPKVRSVEVQVNPELQQQLEGLGYGGDGE